MSEMLLIVLAFALLVALIPLVLLLTMLWRTLSAWRESLHSTATLLERSIDLLATRSPDDFLRVRTSRSISPMYSPSDGDEPDEPEGSSAVGDAYQKAIDEGAPDDVAQYLE